MELNYTNFKHTHFVDIGGIDDHHYLNFLFIIQSKIYPDVRNFSKNIALSKL